jgi:hypothetical protein
MARVDTAKLAGQIKAEERPPRGIWRIGRDDVRRSGCEGVHFLEQGYDVEFSSKDCGEFGPVESNEYSILRYARWSHPSGRGEVLQRVVWHLLRSQKLPARTRWTLCMLQNFHRVVQCNQERSMYDSDDDDDNHNIDNGHVDIDWSS